jgi:membrane protein implicated in regulation of membrane protease activity
MAWAWAWWLGAALLLAVAEMLSLDLFLIMLSGGALVGLLLSLLGVPFWVQVLGFAVASALLLFALRPWLLRHLRDRVPLVETNAAGLVGKTGVAVAEVTEHAGRVKLSGEVWTARTEGGQVVPLGGHVRVVRIAGATAIVARHDATIQDSGAGTSPSPSDRSQETTS